MQVKGIRRNAGGQRNLTTLPFKGIKKDRLGSQGSPNVSGVFIPTVTFRSIVEIVATKTRCRSRMQ